MSDDWYDQIEEPVREVVRRLRNVGINTSCSCGHDMSIECQTMLDGDMWRIHKTLWDYLEEKGQKIDFEVTLKHKVVDGHTQGPMIYIELPQKEVRRTDDTWPPTHMLVKDFDDAGRTKGSYASVRGDRVAFVDLCGNVAFCQTGARAIYDYTPEIQKLLKMFPNGLTKSGV